METFASCVGSIMTGSMLERETVNSSTYSTIRSLKMLMLAQERELREAPIEKVRGALTTGT